MVRKKQVRRFGNRCEMGCMMTRNKIIRAFVAVWLAISLSYFGLRSAVAALMGNQAAARTDEETASGAAEPAEQTDQVEQTEPAAPGPAAQSESVAQSRPDSSSSHTNSSAQKEQSQVEETETETEPQVVAQDVQAENIPSLDEYLSGFTCGSCRRNCSLDNPRCHNGSRLAQAKAQEYYSLYG